MVSGPYHALLDGESDQVRCRLGIEVPFINPYS